MRTFGQANVQCSVNRGRGELTILGKKGFWAFFPLYVTNWMLENTAHKAQLANYLVRNEPIPTRGVSAPNSYVFGQIERCIRHKSKHAARLVGRHLASPNQYFR